MIGSINESPIEEHMNDSPSTKEKADSVDISDYIVSHSDDSLSKDIKKDTKSFLDVEHGEISTVDEFEEDSPYPEVRAAVPPTDDPSMPCNTIRMWTIGLIYSTVGAAVNMFFSLRNPTVTLSVLISELLAYPALQIWDLIFPDREFRIGRLKFNFKPGPFNVKEHALIVVMSSVSFGNAYSTDIILAQRVHYKQRFGFGYEICLTLATQLIGYGLAGLSRRLLVRPASMLWPVNLVQCTLIKTLHRKDLRNAVANGWRISPFRFFLYVFIASFIWNWFPSYIFQALSLFAWVTWIRPNSPTVNQIFGESTGISILPMTFDWNQISAYILSPLMAPADALMNILLGVILFFWIVTPALNFTNTWYGDYLPISSSGIIDHFGNSYNVTRILTKDATFDLDAYQNYSPIFMSTTYALAFGLSFASITSVIFHVILYHGKEIYDRLRDPPAPDIHEKLMKAYDEVPFYWYLSVFLAFFGMMMGTIYGWKTETPWWVIIVGVIFSAVWFIPIGIVQAITNIQLGLNVFTEFIVGYMYPGRPLAMMIFKTVGYITMTQGLAFAADLKFGHYMKLPPRIMFYTQMIATIWSCFVQIGVLDWALGNIDNVCQADQPDNYTCPNATVFFNSSVIWGVIGPKRMFSGKNTYTGLQYFWLAGVLGTILFWALWKKWPQKWWGQLNGPLIFGGTGYIPPATPVNYLAWSGIGLFFNYYLKKIFADWWQKYNFTLSALDTGTQLSVIILFFCLQLPMVNFPDWWGNDGAFNTLDATGAAVRKLVNESAR
nr:unnamed protein product [Schizosaccharomyces pombe]